MVTTLEKLLKHLTLFLTNMNTTKIYWIKALKKKTGSLLTERMWKKTNVLLLGCFHNSHLTLALIIG